MTHEQFEQAAQYWSKKEKNAMPEEALKQVVEKYIQENNTCALATGSGDYVRCTPIEYSYHDGKFWMFSEGGEKFIGLEKNANVSFAIFDKYDGFGNLKSLQIMGRAEIIEPFSDSYNTHAEYKKIPLEALKKLEHPMNLICVTPSRIDVLFSDLKKDGYSIRQTLDFEKSNYIQREQQSIMTLNEKYVECFKNVEIGKKLTRREIIKIIQDKYDVDDGSILPSDLCYNSSNKGVERGNPLLNKKLFIKLRRGVYQYVGPDFDDSGINTHEFGTI